MTKRRYTKTNFQFSNHNHKVFSVMSNKYENKAAMFKRFGSLITSSIFALSVTACGGGSPPKVMPIGGGDRISGYVGNVAADEPQAAIVAKNVLAQGGNAADAAAALGFALTVTLPSRASLGGGGACLAYRPGEDARAFLFLPQPVNTKAERPAAIPMMARGLYLMQAAYGRSDIDDILRLISGMAQRGITVSNAFAQDIAAVQGPLFSDPNIRKIFSREDGQPIQAGDLLSQPRLKLVYDRLITAGIGDIYIGALGQSYAKGSEMAGGGLKFEDMRNALPVEVSALSLKQGNQNFYFLPPPADGGLGMAMAWRALSNGQGDANSVAQNAVGQWRASHSVVYTKQDSNDQQKQAQAVLDEGNTGSGSLPVLPASTAFTVVDRNGQAVSCALTMNNLFGTGRVAGTTGIIMASSPQRTPIPMLTSAIVSYENRFQAAIGASGQRDAAAAGAETLSTLLNSSEKEDGQVAHAGTPQGRVNAIYCSRGLPGDSNRCHAYTDPQGAGIALNQ